MATLSVYKFKDENGAQQMLDTVSSLQTQHLIKLQDAAIVTWPTGKKKPKTQQLANLGALGALNGTFWGILFGFLFFMPLMGAAIGAVMGGLSGYFSDYGIDDNFIKQVREKVTPGTSALFMLTSDAVVDKVVEAFKQHQFELISTNLPTEQEEKLRELFAQE